MDGSSAQSPIPIPPLIPLPVTAPHNEPKTRDEKADVFATLFSPPTPRASPTLTPEPGQSQPAGHTRTESTDSDFGAFVSVSASEDPLQLGADSTDDVFNNQGFFDKFTEDAKVASERKRREVLDELFQHEEDPLYWLQGASKVNQCENSTPTPSCIASETASSVGKSLIDLDSPSDPQAKHVVPPILPRSPSATPLTSHTSVPAVVPPNEVPEDTLIDLDSPRPETERLSRPLSYPHHTAAAPHVRSPSLPPSSPTRISPPEIQRTQSFFSSPSFPSRMVSSLLSSTIRPASSASRTNLSISSPASSHTDDPSTSRLPPVVVAAASHLANLSRSAPHSRSATFSEGGPGLDAAITHGTPFASHPFVPPSGAPGFTGDRQWDKGFEFDKTQVERKSVRLTGRKEMTVPVLTVEIADMLRPFFPALARLPRAWTLLYSLDQHGISLNTLYARCQDFRGSALLVIRDANDAVFGAWMGEGIHPSKGGYYGSGESFLWQLVGKDRVRVYKWTGKNDYVALCETDYISFGGGDGNYGLWLDQTLSDGSSARCPTFDNEPLCSLGPRQGEAVTFECVGLEVWGVG
ncbi:TLD-domain-containing protein [Trametes elegans]|nr:TLD-domain-containing protein [Trametes elegans]